MRSIRLDIILAAWSPDIAELWGMLASTSTQRPCTRCFASQDDLRLRSARDQLNDYIKNTSSVPPRTVDATLHLLAHLDPRLLKGVAMRPMDYATSPFMDNLLWAFDIFRDSDFDELHVIWLGWVADLITAVLEYVKTLGTETAILVDTRLKSLGSFPGLVQLKSYDSKSHTGKVWETLLQVLPAAIQNCVPHIVTRAVAECLNLIKRTRAGMLTEPQLLKLCRDWADHIDYVRTFALWYFSLISHTRCRRSRS